MKSEILIMRLDANTKTQLKSYAKKQRRTITSIIEELIEVKFNNLKK